MQCKLGKPAVLEVVHCLLHCYYYLGERECVCVCFVCLICKLKQSGHETTSSPGSPSSEQCVTFDPKGQG